MTRLSLATRIFVGYTGVLLTFGAVSVFSIVEMHRSRSEIRLMGEGFMPLASKVAEIQAFQAKQAEDTDRLGSPQTNVETRRATIQLARLYFFGVVADKVAQGQKIVRAIDSFAPSSEAPFLREVAEALDELDLQFKAYADASEQAFRTLWQEAPDWSEANERLAVLDRQEGTLAVSIRILLTRLEARSREGISAMELRARRATGAIIALSLVAIAVGLLATGISARALRPVRTLIEGAARIGRGDYTGQLGVRGDDEISVLAQRFDEMARSLREREAQLREKQEALLRAEQLAAVGRISAQVAHEIRNPLSSIGLNVEMLEDQIQRATFDQPSDAREAQQLLRSVTQELDRLGQVTEHYLRMARLPAPELEREDVGAVLERVLEFSGEELARSQIHLVKELPGGELPVMADEGQLRQVFLNLIRNGREAMAQGGTLTVAARPVDHQVEVSFADTGAGMSGEVRARIFEPFFSTKEGGTGLGLAVSRQIVQAHGGIIECESTPGGGTKFVLRLPSAST